MILERMFGATLEDPRFTLQDDAAFTYLGAGELSESGVRVNREIANTYSPWYRGINLVSRDCAKLPLYTYRRTPAQTSEGQEGKDRFKDHPAYPILRRKSNRLHTAFHFKLLMVSHAMSTGNGYAYITRRNDASLLPVDEGGGLIPMDPNTTVPVRETMTSDAGEVVSDKLWYVTTIQGQQKKLDSDDVLHIKGMGFDGLTGYDVVKMANGTIGRGISQMRFANKYFANGAHLSVVLETPGTMSTNDKKLLLQSWNDMHQGLNASHRTAILTNGLKANQLANTARNAQLIEGEEFNIRLIANFLGIPPHKLGAKTGESYASKEQENLDYLFQALDFWLGNFEDECFDKLLTEQEKKDESVYMEFSREKLFEADLKTKAEYFRVALGGVPWAKQNEARSAFNMNPVDGGDDIKVPLNVAGNLEKDSEDNESSESGAAEESEPSKTGKAGKSKAAAEQGNVQATALNGAQMTAMQGIVQATADKLLPPESAKAQLQVAFPLAEESKIDAIIDPLKDFEQPKKEPPPGFQPSGPPQGPPQMPPDKEPETDDANHARLGAALRQQLSVTVTRMVRRAGHAADAVAKDPKRFMAWLDSFESDHGRTVSEDVRAVEAACHAFCGRADSEALAGKIVAGIHDGLLEVSGKVTAAKLPAHVTIEMARLETALRDDAVRELMP